MGIVLCSFSVSSIFSDISYCPEAVMGWALEPMHKMLEPPRLTECIEIWDGLRIPSGPKVA